MMLGGSPIRVDVPPTFDARTRGIRMISGLMERETAISMATPVKRSMVVTLSRKAEETAVKTMR